MLHLVFPVLNFQLRLVQSVQVLLCWIWLCILPLIPNYKYQTSFIIKHLQHCKTMLITIQDELLKELDSIHASGELAIMDMYHSVERAIDQMDTACRFTDQVLAQGNGVEILSMKKHITGQLLSLINGVPRLEPTTTIVFKSDSDAFVKAVTATFGHFVKPGSKVS